MWRRVALEEDRLDQRMTLRPIDSDSPRNTDKQHPLLARSLSRRSHQQVGINRPRRVPNTGVWFNRRRMGVRVKEAACAPSSPSLPFCMTMMPSNVLYQNYVGSSYSQGRCSAAESVQGQNAPGSGREYDHGGDEVGPPGEAESCSSPTTPFDPFVGADRPL